ncbi:MAG: DUF3024 domain-containing protein [Bacteroidetes bacterium]|nr:DUF3024 domain-containing protein [Bacteroidota bacterium]MBI3483380.1 DUF3024 domain-containing protein [Bacteroidota bacterium]
MAVSNLQVLDIIEVMESFLLRKRPPEQIRPKLDIVYKIDGQSVIVNEVRPRWNNPSEIVEHGVAKATFVKAKNHWKIFWLRADLKWHSYNPKPTVKALKDFVKLIEEDAHHCFWG